MAQLDLSQLPPESQVVFEALLEYLGPLREQIRFGSGTPEAAVTAPVGTLYLRTNGGANTTLYVKESGTGNTGWVAK
jgi:hypothetical protein